MSDLSPLNTPQLVGSIPKNIAYFSNPKSPSTTGGCAAKVCKVLLPLLGAVALVLLGLMVAHLLKKKDGKKEQAPYTLQYPPAQQQPPAAAQPQPRAYPRNVPQFPAGGEGPQPMTADMRSGPGGGAAYASQMQDPRYTQRTAMPYQDNNLHAYQSYSQAVGAEGKAQMWDETQFNKMIIQQKLPALVAFVSEGCGWCHKLKPAFAEAAKHSKITLAMVDAAGADGLRAKYNVRGFPTLIKFVGGEAVGVYSGDRSVQDLVNYASQ